MIKLLGSVLVIAATTYLGYTKANQLVNRTNQLRQLRTCLALLQTEIGYGTRALDVACRYIAAGQTGPLATLFETCATQLASIERVSTFDCFRQAIEQEWHHTSLGPAERTIFLDFCRTLGVSNRADQLHHIALTRDNLRVEEEKAREEQGKYAKMFRTLGILAGCVIVIIMF